MKLGEYFMKAIHNSDWEKVCVVYKQITGETIEPPKPQKSIAIADTEIDIYESIAETETHEVVEDKWVEEETAKPISNKQVTVDDFRVERNNAEEEHRRIARREPVSLSKRKNMFDDDKTIAINESVIDNPSLGVKNPVPRGERGSAVGTIDTGQKIDVECSMCGKKETVSTLLAVGWHKDAPSTPEQNKENTYKCNDCQTPSGRAKAERKKKKVC